MTDLPPAPPNPTQCDQYFVDGVWRVWCEVDLAGPCEGCPDAPAPVEHTTTKCPDCVERWAAFAARKITVVEWIRCFVLDRHHWTWAHDGRLTSPWCVRCGVWGSWDKPRWARQEKRGTWADG